MTSRDRYHFYHIKNFSFAFLNTPSAVGTGQKQLDGGQSFTDRIDRPEYLDLNVNQIKRNQLMPTGKFPKESPYRC